MCVFPLIVNPSALIVPYLHCGAYNFVMSNSIDPIALRQRLESLRRAGVQHLPKPRAGAVDESPVLLLDETHPEPAMPRPTKQSGIAPAQEKSGEFVVSTAATLEMLASEVASCTLCSELASTRSQTVFGVGNPKARLCLMGEAPGADEDRTGIPFVGRAGQLLTKIIEACTLSRDEVYILNVLKCRPPGNRNPSPDESHNCRRFLLRQLQLIEPEFICCLGAVAAQNLLETTETIGKLRGRFHDYHGIRVLCTYHPAYLLRNPAAKHDTWADMKILMKEMGVEL